MKTPRSQITPVLANLTLKSGTSAKRLGQEIAAYLLDENRVSELDSLMRDVVAYRADEGIVEVNVVSAHELTPAARKDVEREVRQQFPKAKRVIVGERIDAELLGGVRLELVDRQLDLTLRSKLNHFKELTAVERA
jgi:F0F1-type ATP synthase delta subunit